MMDIDETLSDEDGGVVLPRAARPTPSPSPPLFDCSKISGETDVSSWSSRRRVAEHENSWVASIYAGKEVTFDLDGRASTWIIGRRLAAEKEHRLEKSASWPYDACAVFECTQVQSNGCLVTAVCKIYLQIPYFEVKHDEAKPKRNAPKFVRSEVEALERLWSAGDDAPGPQYFSHKYDVQTQDMWVPGGFACLILMEKLVGITPTDEWYWSRSLQERDEIRDAFKESYTKLLKLGIDHNDYALRNLIWNPDTRKCYIIDFEGVDFIPRKDIPAWGFHEVYWKVWGLRGKSLDKNGGW